MDGQRWTPWLILLTAWFLVGTVSALELYLTPRPGTLPLSFPLLLRVQLVNAAPWVPAVAVAVHLAHRWPLRRHDLLRPLTLHLATGILVVLALNVAMAVLRDLVAPPGMFPAPIVESAVTELMSWGHLALAVYLGVVVAATIWDRPPEDGA